MALPGDQTMLTDGITMDDPSWPCMTSFPVSNIQRSERPSRHSQSYQHTTQMHLIYSHTYIYIYIFFLCYYLLYVNHLVNHWNVIDSLLYNTPLLRRLASKLAKLQDGWLNWSSKLSLGSMNTTFTLDTAVPIWGNIHDIRHRTIFRSPF